MTFKDFNLDPDIIKAIDFMGIKNPTKIQELAMPEILQGNDLLACAQTGTGKTAAFVLPVLHKIYTQEQKHINTLIIVPTRELAIQIDQQIQGIAYFTHAECVVLYGGTDGASWDQEKNALVTGAEIVVATPGKLITHLNMGYVDFSHLQHLILDEADRMLDIGFLNDILQIISHTPDTRQTLLFSATMPPKVKELANKILQDPVEVKTEISKPAEGVLQATYLAHNHQKLPLIISLISDKPDYDSILIFTATKKNVNEIARELKKTQDSVEGISSDLEQKEREEVLLQFRAKNTRILVATDVLSRGIDIKDINLIINYDVPGDAEDYVHRVGRTARAKSTGVAITLINEEDMFKFHRIEQLIEREIIRIPLPKELGEQPVWNLNQRRKPNTWKKRNSKKKSGVRKGRRK